MSFENRVLTKIGKSYLNFEEFHNLFITSKNAALDEVMTNNLFFHNF